MRTSPLRVLLVTNLLALFECNAYAFLASPSVRWGRSLIRVSSGYYQNDVAPRCVVPRNSTLDILYEDPEMLVINKPAGMVIQFASGSVESAVVFHLKKNASYENSWPWKSPDSFEGIVHRIDKPTSGILVLAKHPEAAKALHASFEGRRVHKAYLAIAQGLPNKQPTRSTKSTPSQSHAILVDANNKAPEHTTTTSELLPHQRKLSKDIKDCGRSVAQALELLQSASQSSSSADRPSASCFSAAISVCMRAGQRDTALATFDSIMMSNGDVSPNLQCYRTCISLCANDPPLYEKALELVDLQEQQQGKMHPHCVSSAISACGRAGQMEAVTELLGRMVEQQQRSANDDTELIGCLKAAIKAYELCGATNSTIRAVRDQLDFIMSSDIKPVSETNIGREVQLEQNGGIVVDAPIGKLGPRLMGIVPESQGGRSARSTVTPLAFDGTLSLNRVVIETGRTHQIRVHMASVLGCPLAGDRMYNIKNDKSAERCMLHAAELRIPHPSTGAALRLFCPPPPDFSALAGDMLDSYESSD
jgi:23S rRNA-/tRNA-specific pseudouridylate synthase